MNVMQSVVIQMVPRVEPARPIATTTGIWVTDISYGGWAGTPNVAFGYDSVGNRTSMTDGLGSVSYAYNTLSLWAFVDRSFAA